MTQFLHGVETLDIKQGTATVRQVRSGIIGLVGTAPKGDVNKLTICLNSTDDAQFGEITANHSIPRTLKSLREQGCSMVMVVNVGSDTDTIDIADIIGTTTEDGSRTGIQLFNDGYGMYGYDAKILIAPYFSAVPAVAGALEVMAEKIRAMAYIDLPLGLKPSEAIASRGNVSPLGLNIYQTSSTRIRICYPHRKVFDPLTNDTILEPASIAFAGVRARVDKQVGYWTSSSNKPAFATLGLERLITARIDDKDTEANLLNEAGISTFFKSFGTGYDTWGNRSASFPVNTEMANFEQVQRTKDMIEIAIHQASKPFADSDIRQPQIDHIVKTVDGYFEALYTKGAVVGGTAYFDPARNPISEVQDGWLRFGYKFTPIIPNERITYEREVTGEYFLNLKSVNMGV